MEDLINMMVESLINEHQFTAEVYNQIPITDDMVVVSVSEEILDLIYTPCDCKTLGGEYYLINQGKVVYMGHIDAEGLEATVVKDLTTLSDFINVGIAARIGDKEQLKEYLGDHSLMERYLNQINLGWHYLKENHVIR